MALLRILYIICSTYRRYTNRRAKVAVQTIRREGAAGGTPCTAHMRINEYNIFKTVPDVKYYKILCILCKVFGTIKYYK